MAADIRLDRYVQRKLKRGREFYYFRIVRGGKERRIPLPHPFDDGYRQAYDAAWGAVFGVNPAALRDPQGFAAMIEAHRDSARYRALSAASRRLRDMACDLILDRWGQFSPRHIKPIHVQAMYDSLSDRPATANRRLDDISAVFSWARPRGFIDDNPCARIERVASDGTYEPWPDWALEKLFTQGAPHLVRPALGAVYTGQRRGDLLTKLCPGAVIGGVWHLRQGKTGTPVPVPLHPVVLAMVEERRAQMRADGIVDPNAAVFHTSRGQGWSPSGYGASWRKEIIRLGLHTVEPRLVFHGLRTTSATLIASAVAKNPDLYGGIARVQAMLAHLSERMARHYARRAEVEALNAESVLLLPDFGNQSA